MDIEQIRQLAALYEELDYFLQVTIFVGLVLMMAIPTAIVVSLLTSVRIIAEGIACLLSLGRITFDETTQEGWLTKFWDWLKGLQPEPSQKPAPNDKPEND